MTGNTGDGSVPAEELLAAAIRGETMARPRLWTSGARIREMTEAISYHGVAGLLYETRPGLDGWPDEVRQDVRRRAQGQAMWELRHRSLLVPLLEAFAQGGVPALLMKGTAIAYDLYDNPISRSRADTDLLVDKDHLSNARSILTAAGFVRHPSPYALAEDLALQEVWGVTSADGTAHHIDLHWQVMNAAALKDVLTFDECWADVVALPRLSPNARAMDRRRMLLHACLHRAMHVTAPYFVGDKAYFGGNRLIWLYDINLLASALTDDQWAGFCAMAQDKNLSAPCLAGLAAARQNFRTEVPQEVLESLQLSCRQGGAATFLGESRALWRAWRNWRAVPGIAAKFRYFRARMLPSPNFMRSKYPGMSGFPLAMLYLRRVAELLVSRRPAD